MKNFTSLLVFVLFACTVSAQKKSPDKKDDTPKPAVSKPEPAKPSPPKTETAVFKPSPSIPTPSNDNNNQRPITNVDVRDDIKPTAKPSTAASTSDESHEISRDDFGSNNADSSNVVHPDPDDENPGTDNQDDNDFKPFCNTLSFQTLRCNQRWFRIWYRDMDNACAWSGDVTFINLSDTTLTLYIEQHAASEMPTTEQVNSALLSSKQRNSFLEILPGDSLTFKMPCGAIQYEAEQKKERRQFGRLRRHMGWVRTVSTDVRIEIKEEDLE